MAIGLVLALATATSVLSGTASAAARASLRIEPAALSVAKFSTFTVKVVQDTPVATSGAQASIDFDPTILQVVSVSAGGPYSQAPVFLPRDTSADIRTANESGHLAQIAAAFTPPDSVAPGTSDFLFVKFRAVGCGTSSLGLPTSGPFNAQMISGQPEAYGHEVPVTTVDGQVTTCVGADAITADAGPADASVSRSIGTGDGVPVGLIGVASVLAIGGLGGLLWRSRRREELDDIVE